MKKRNLFKASIISTVLCAVITTVAISARDSAKDMLTDLNSPSVLNTYIEKSELFCEVDMSMSKQNYNDSLKILDTICTENLINPRYSYDNIEIQLPESSKDFNCTVKDCSIRFNEDTNTVETFSRVSTNYNNNGNPIEYYYILTFNEELKIEKCYQKLLTEWEG